MIAECSQAGNKRLSTAHWLLHPFCPNWKWKVHFCPIPYHTMPYHTIPYLLSQSLMAIPPFLSQLQVKSAMHCLLLYTLLFHTISYHTISFLPHIIPHHIITHHIFCPIPYLLSHQITQLKGYSRLFVQTGSKKSKALLVLGAFFTSNRSCFIPHYMCTIPCTYHFYIIFFHSRFLFATVYKQEVMITIWKNHFIFAHQIAAFKIYSNR